MWATIAALQGDSGNPRELLRLANFIVISSNRKTLSAGTNATCALSAGQTRPNIFSTHCRWKLARGTRLGLACSKFPAVDFSIHDIETLCHHCLSFWRNNRCFF